jgi:hypothetical protein
MGQSANFVCARKGADGQLLNDHTVLIFSRRETATSGQVSEHPSVDVLDNGAIVIECRGGTVILTPEEVKELLKQLAVALAECQTRQKRLQSD